MAEVDTSIVITDKVIDDLMDDWFERDGETFLKIRKTGRLGWEDTLKKGASYSSYILKSPTKKDLIKRAYSLAKDTIVAMNTPFKVRIKITTGLGGSSYTDSKVVCVNTSMFDDLELSVGEKLDTFLGTTIHEGCHLLYTEFDKMTEITTQEEHTIFNILEDERIEEICGEQKPGFANFLEKSKYYYFDKFYLDYVAKKEKESELTPFDRIMSCFLHIIRYPKYLNEKEIVEFAHYLLAIKKVVVPYPETTLDTIKASKEIFEILKDFYKDTERKKSKSSGGDGDGDSGGDGDSDGEGESLDAKAERKLIDDMKAASEALKGLATTPASAPVTAIGDERGLSSLQVSTTVLADHEILGELCEGTVELGSSNDTFFMKPNEDKFKYMESLSRVKKYIPAIAKVLKNHAKDYAIIHRSMRSGILDSNKLAEAYQGVPTVYKRKGEVKTDKVAVCVLIDESGSMGGDRIKAARDTAVLINEALGKVPNVELFMYGHSGDMKRSESTELYVYREKEYTPRYSLGSAKARSENRDGVAILEVAKRVRKQTKNPILFFILSDGTPAARHYFGVSAMQHVKECVEKVEKMGFYVIQVCINHVYDPGKMFKHYVIMEDMSTLAIKLGTAIKKAAMKTAKVQVS